MKKQNEFYALQVTIPGGEKLLCWRGQTSKDKNQFYFSIKAKGYDLPEPPTLFKTRKDANKAWDKVPAKGGNLKQFVNVIEAKKTKVVKVIVSM